jgi:hypothetical protein
VEGARLDVTDLYLEGFAEISTVQLIESPERENFLLFEVARYDLLFILKFAARCGSLLSSSLLIIVDFLNVKGKKELVSMCERSGGLQKI